MTEDYRQFLNDLVCELQTAIGPEDLRLDVFRTGSVPSIDCFEAVDPDQAAVRVVHMPSGTVEMYNAYRTRIENKMTALVRVLAKVQASA